MQISVPETENTKVGGSEILAVADSPTLASAVGSARLRILVVDDNVDAAEMMAEALIFLGHEVLVVHDGPQALVAAATFRATTALLDIGLPVIDGYELARLLRGIWADHPVKLVAITGYGQESDKQRAKDAGFDVHLVKPIELDVLLAVLDATPGRNCQT